jgi:hypothetical protein
MVSTGRLESVLLKTLDLPEVVWHRLRSEADQELRATLICLLTAALASEGTAEIIGEAEGGWFWLLPGSMWQSWATQGHQSAAKNGGIKGDFRSGPSVPRLLSAAYSSFRDADFRSRSTVLKQR